MEKRELPIGVIDSGLGGISVLKELLLAMPNEKYIYIGDSANAPYGVKGPEEILMLTENSVKALLERRIKALVIACNTATGVAVKYLREKYAELPIIGLEPALKPAVENCEGGAVAVMATPVTLSEEKFRILYDRYKENTEIITVGAPKIVEFVEKGVFEGEELEGYLAELFEPYKEKNIESVVLGCTHFPFVTDAISKVTGAKRIYDGGRGAALETRRRLEALGLLSEENDGYVSLENTLDDPEILRLSEVLLER
ncbi:MAG: glutamate racemase [Ruminococcaceae bacterium]|nr:glutamate racemase [Oscillospiraceae bacterium]